MAAFIKIHLADSSTTGDKREKVKKLKYLFTISYRLSLFPASDLANFFGVKDDTIICSWLHSLNYIRNICAHHSRLWNILVDITPMKYFNKDASKVWLTNAEVKTAQSSKLYYTLCVILYLLQTVNPKTKFRQHFKDLLAKYPKVNVGYMGFPTGWETHPLWQNPK